jgi:hypothetical protein
VSSSGALFKTGSAILRIIIGASALVTTGCAYFHPAFVTNPSQLSANATAFGERGVLVCERHSLRRKDCTVMPYSEVERLFSDALQRY